MPKRHGKKPPFGNNKSTEIDQFDRALNKNQYLIIGLFTLAVFIKTVLLSAAYPIFTNVDEPEHYDVISKYGRGHIPVSEDIFDDQTSLITIVKSTREYILNEQQIAGYKDIYRGKIQDIPEGLKHRILQNTKHRCGEGGQPPLYYSLMALAKIASEKIGLYDEYIVYALRSVNAFFLSALVIMAFIFVKRYYPSDTVLAIGVPVLLMMIPQTAFYQIGNDVLSPLVFLAACYFLFAIIFEKDLKLSTAALAGIFTAAALLTKLSNAPVYLLLGVAVISKMRLIKHTLYKKQIIIGIVIMAFFAVVPPALWFIRNYMVLGDFSGFGNRIEMLGWVRKSFAAWLMHPIFSFKGLFIFARDLIAKSWRGEFAWHGESLRSPVADAIYLGSTLLFAGTAMMRAMTRKKGGIEALLSLIVITFISELVYLSVSFDFGRCYYPSATYPFITSGRLILGALVPLLILYVQGFRIIVARLGASKTAHQLFFLIMIMVVTDVIEFKVNLPVFMAKRNLYYYMMEGK